MKTKFMFALSLVALITIDVAIARENGGIIAKPSGPLNKCLKYYSPSEPYKYISKTTNMTTAFITAAQRAGYSNIQSIPQSFKNQKQAEYCYSYVDPLGFPHHISKLRACSLTVQSASPAAGGLTAKLNHSGCYLTSSKRHMNRFRKEPARMAPF